MISDAWMQELLSRTDIASVIGEYTTLTPKGGKLWACCPFHNEKTPSFKVDTSTQLYYCFGCHKGGNVITFLKEKENLSGFEAIEELARRAGMDIPSKGYNREEAERIKNQKQRLLNANRDAARYYYSNLANAADAHAYLAKRGLSDGIITRFGLGYAPDSWTSLCEHLSSLGYTDDELISAGLAKRTESGRVFDFFRNRVIFPIIDERGNVLGFGGRTMGTDKPKYLNTGDTPIYSKKNNVYALNMLKKGTHGDIIIVEGYMDAIALHTAGVDNAVATLGTALTENQARLLKRRTSRIYVAYDGDSAGQNATMRGLDILANEGLEVRVIALTDGLDPDDFVKKYGANGFLSLKDKSLTLVMFKLEHIAASYDMTSPDDRQNFAIKACEIISALQPVEQDRYYNYLAHKTGISLDTLRAQGGLTPANPEKRNNYAYIRNNREKQPSFAKSNNDRLELTLAACAASDKNAARYIADNALEFITRSELRDFVSAAAKSYEINGNCDTAFILESIDGDVSAIAASVLEQHIEDAFKTAQDCISRMKLDEVERAITKLSGDMDSHQISSDEYKKRLSELMAELKKYK